MVYLPGAKNKASDAISRYPTGAPHPPKMQLSDDIFHISHITLLPDLNIPLQLKAGTHLEDQQSCDNMEDGLMHSVAAQSQDIKTVDWNQVHTATQGWRELLKFGGGGQNMVPGHICMEKNYNPMELL